MELQRLDADLHTLYERLINREYLETDFSQKNKYNIPERTQEFFKYLSDYCKNARTWEAILQKFEMAKISRIANLCPGRAPKIELALYYLGYQGVIEIIDKDTKAMDQIQNFMHLFKYEYKIQKRVTDIFAAKKSTPYELIIANHIIDDTFLFFYAKRKKIGIEDIYTNESKLVQLWETVLKEDTTAIQEAFLEELSNFLICISEKGTIVIFSQYQSYIE
ncbi:MAG: hypothetical protein LBO09_02210 [Candidatus Peribacteria bacterium]|nr:hypothetical protein [Candidatus Peribacteria bacterium]